MITAKVTALPINFSGTLSVAAQPAIRLLPARAAVTSRSLALYTLTTRPFMADRSPPVR